MKTDPLERVKQFYRRHRRLPSYAEMLKLFGFASKNAVYKIMRKWIEAGLLVKEGSRFSPASKFFALPLFGVVKAGFPILADENKEYLSIDEYLIDDPQSTFLLKVSGDSLINAGIFDGDIVIIKTKNEAQNGDLVLAQIDREWTLKIFKRDRQRHVNYLLAANPKYPPFYPKHELQIHGIVRGVIRRFN